MEKQLPKNVRQIGNVSDNPKIYIEDYVDTFFSQLCERAEEFPVGAFLIGETVKADDQDCVFIHGAVQVQGIKTEGMELVLDAEALKMAYGQCKEYFGEAEVLGWFAVIPNSPLGVNQNLLAIHEVTFPKELSIFAMKDPIDKDEVFYAYKFNDLMQIGGHYIYYERNPSMQNYMIASRKQNGVTPIEVVEDRAAKDFRSLVRDKSQHTEQKQSSRFVYAASTFLVLVVLIIGITTINNYDKMQSVQKTLEHISQAVSKNSEAPKTQQTSGTVVAETGEPPVAAQPETLDPAGQAAQDKAHLPAPAVENTNQGVGGDDGIYIVQKGDTLAKISKKAYGDIAHVDTICKMNGLKDGNLIYIGQELILP